MPTPVKLPAKVEQVIQHTDAVKSLLLRPSKKCPMFKPGQFLHLAMDPYDPSSNWPESRVFSIASSPTRRETLKIIFAVKGAFTRRMFEEIHEGDEVWVKLPYGDFTFPDDERTLILVAGGTGITPFLSYLEYATDRGLSNRVALCLGIREPHHFVCGPLLRDCIIRLPHFMLKLYLEQGEGVDGFDVTGRGLIPLRELVREDPDASRNLYYLSGPPEMIAAFKETLLFDGIDEGSIRVDNWV
jgi:ferredoxin-NADP reductase